MDLDPNILTVPPAQQPNAFTAGAALPWQGLGFTCYLFANVGDAIPLHSHPVGQNHTVDVKRGTIIYRTVNADGSNTDVTYSAPYRFLVDPLVEHSIIALSSPENSSGTDINDWSTLSAVVINDRQVGKTPMLIAEYLQSLNATATTVLQTMQGIQALTTASA